MYKKFFIFLLISDLSAQEPIDVVIPCAPKDAVTLEKSINGIRSYGKGIRRIIIVSSQQLTKNAEWVPESSYPFNKYDLATAIFGIENYAHQFVDAPHSRIGWIYQQLLKLYAPFVIKDISSNVLVLDADLVFIKPTEFIDKDRLALFSTSDEFHRPYFTHAASLIPGFKKVYPQYSGIVHHMLFQKDLLEKLFKLVETTHKKPFWQAFCQKIDKAWVNLSSVSEYEIYFNFVFQNYPERVKIRRLRKKECWTIKELNHTIANRNQEPYDCTACQEWRREKKV